MGSTGNGCFEYFLVWYALAKYFLNDSTKKVQQKQDFSHQVLQRPWTPSQHHVGMCYNQTLNFQGAYLFSPFHRVIRNQHQLTFQHQKGGKFQELSNTVKLMLTSVRENKIALNFHKEGKQPSN